jgi:DNA-binding CsgD family transcriptional regulator
MTAFSVRGDYSRPKVIDQNGFNLVRGFEAVMPASKDTKLKATADRRPLRPWSKDSPGLILLDSALNPVAFNEQAVSILSYPESPNVNGPANFSVPEQILTEIRHGSALPAVTHFGAGRRRYVGQVFEMRPYKEGEPCPVFAVLLQRNSSFLEAVHEVGAAFNLTARECEVVRGIAIGLNSKALAEQMGLSPNTLKAYLRLIMIKMGVRTRAEILSKILEHHPNPEPDALSAAAGSRPLH